MSDLPTTGHPSGTVSGLFRGQNGASAVFARDERGTGLGGVRAAISTPQQWPGGSIDVKPPRSSSAPQSTRVNSLRRRPTRSRAIYGARSLGRRTHCLVMRLSGKGA